MAASLANRSGGMLQGARAMPSARPRAIAVARRPAPVCRSLGKDAVDGWLDVAKLLAGSTGAKSPYDELASAIGKDVYVDVAGWHLYLRDMNAAPGIKMAAALAQHFGPLANRGLKEADVVAVLKKVPVKLGSGKTQLSLYDVCPSMCIGDLTRILEDFGRRK